MTRFSQSSYSMRIPPLRLFPLNLDHSHRAVPRMVPGCRIVVFSARATDDVARAV